MTVGEGVGFLTSESGLVRAVVVTQSLRLPSTPPVGSVLFDGDRRLRLTDAHTGGQLWERVIEGAGS